MGTGYWDYQNSCSAPGVTMGISLGFPTNGASNTVNFTVSNNMIYLSDPNGGQGAELYGINDELTDQSGGHTNYFYNTVIESGAKAVRTTYVDFCYIRQCNAGSPPTTVVQNNIFITNRSNPSSTHGGVAAIACDGSNVNTFTSDYNFLADNLYSSQVGYYGTGSSGLGTAYSFNNWLTHGDVNNGTSRTASSITTSGNSTWGYNSGTLDIDSLFTNLSIANFNVRSNITNQPAYEFIKNLANPISSTVNGLDAITWDYNNITRGTGVPFTYPSVNTASPDMGADEFLSCTRPATPVAQPSSGAYCSSATASFAVTSAGDATTYQLADIN